MGCLAQGPERTSSRDPPWPGHTVALGAALTGLLGHCGPLASVRLWLPLRLWREGLRGGSTWTDDLAVPSVGWGPWEDGEKYSCPLNNSAAVAGSIPNTGHSRTFIKRAVILSPLGRAQGLAAQGLT